MEKTHTHCNSSPAKTLINFQVILSFVLHHFTSLSTSFSSSDSWQWWSTYGEWGHDHCLLAAISEQGRPGRPAIQPLRLQHCRRLNPPEGVVQEDGDDMTKVCYKARIAGFKANYGMIVVATNGATANIDGEIITDADWYRVVMLLSLWQDHLFLLVNNEDLGCKSKSIV